MSKDLRVFLKELEESNELIHISDELSTKHEIAAAIKYIAQRNKAVLFERVKGYNIQVVGNLFGKRKRLAMAFGVEEDELDETYLTRSKNLIKPKIVTSGPVQEVVESKIDICKTIPVLTMHEKDVGPYFSSAITIAKDPETGIRGMGLHRILVYDKDTIGLFLGTPPLSNFLTKAEKKEKPLEIAVASGVDPLTFFASIFYAPEGIDKYDIAGGFAQSPIELVRCRSVDIEVPANAEFVLEGYIIPHRRKKEGPFGESTGYYLTYDNPVAKIKTITHRKNPIYHALVPFTVDVKGLMDVMMKPYVLPLVQNVLPQVKQIEFSGIGEVAIVQIDKRSDEDGPKVIDYLFSNPFFKIVVLTDGDVDITDPDEVAWALATRVRPDRDVIIKSDLPGSMIDPSTRGGEITPDLSLLITKTSKIGIDATKPLAELERFEKIDVPLKIKERISRMMKGKGF